MVKKQKRVKKGKQSDSKLFAFLAVLLSVVGFIIALLAKKDDKYVMYYAKQSLILFLTGIIVKILSVLLIMTIIGIIAVPILWIMYIIIWIIALINAISGKQKETPLVGHYAKKINL